MSTRTYETMFIVHPDTTGDAHSAVIDKFQKVLTDQGGEILKVEDWGSRKLAYPIRKVSRGSYVLFYFHAAPDAIREFERRMRIDDAVIRFQTLVHEGEVPALVEEAKQAEAGESEAAEAEEETEEA